MITACILAKNAEASIHLPILSVKPHVEKIIVVDDSSTDATWDKASQLGAEVLKLPFTVAERGFAEAANWMVSQVISEWIFVIDSDEILGDAHRLPPLTRFPGKDVWSLPRRKWLNYEKKSRDELEAYPDWQIRLFRNIPGNRWTGEMHVRFLNRHIHYAYAGPHIEHPQHQFRTPEIREQRAALYEDLAKRQGVYIHGGALKESK